MFKTYPRSQSLNQASRIQSLTLLTTTLGVPTRCIILQTRVHGRINHKMTTTAQEDDIHQRVLFYFTVMLSGLSYCNALINRILRAHISSNISHKWKNSEQFNLVFNRAKLNQKPMWRENNVNQLPLSVTYLEILPSHSSHVHQHNSRVYSRFSVVWMSGKAVIPSYSRLFMFRCHCSNLCGIKFLQ